MERIRINPRNRWQEKVESLGFDYHTTEIPYWDESAFYQFSMKEINQIEEATHQLWQMCLEAVQFVIDTQAYPHFRIPEWVVPLIERSWEEDDPSIYGRFDFVFKNNQIKLLEFNADTPTSLFETSIIQWDWLQEIFPTKDQFNSIHEKLIHYWGELNPCFDKQPLYFSCVKNQPEDYVTVLYLQDCAAQAGLLTQFIYIEDIGWDGYQGLFVDLNNFPMKNIFKLYPYEWLLEESFGKYLMEEQIRMNWIEPAWKMILSNKALLPLLWHLFPEHPLLLKSYFEPHGMESYVRKPLFSREGANIDMYRKGRLIEQSAGDYGTEGYIFQELFELPDFGNQYALIGSWLIGQEPAGICIRESDSLITHNRSRFVPHLIS